jgi:hypothetical protein
VGRDLGSSIEKMHPWQGKLRSCTVPPCASITCLTIASPSPKPVRFWALTSKERRALSGMFTTESVRALLTSLNSRADGEAFELLDAAYWVKCCSSLSRL